jgi:hypothetical protein
MLDIIGKYLLLEVYYYMDIHSVVNMSVVSCRYYNMSKVLDINNCVSYGYKNLILISKYWNNIKLGIKLHNSDIEYLLFNRLNDFANVYHLNMSVSIIASAPLFQNLQSVNLSYCKFLTDISALNNIHTVNLRGCSKLQDISPLSNSYNINISHCFEVKHIQPLYHVSIINIAYCYKITDIFRLCHAKQLTISKIQYHKLPSFIKYIKCNDNINVI